jgi:hypothetical protein
VDLAKSVFSVCAVEITGHVQRRQDLGREAFALWLAQVPAGTVVAMEACSGAHHWARRCLDLRPAAVLDGGYFTVREPFPSKASMANIVFGQVSRKMPLRITSQMPDYGVIFSDGIEAMDYMAFNSGMEAIIDVSNRSGHLIV